MLWPNQAPMTLPCQAMEGSPASHADIKYLVHLFLTGALQIPHQVDLNSLFFLTTRFNFIHHWQLWILPSLERIHPEGHSLLMVDTHLQMHRSHLSLFSASPTRYMIKLCELRCLRAIRPRMALSLPRSGRNQKLCAHSPKTPSALANAIRRAYTSAVRLSK
jgi:hypothetical protein